MLFNKYTTPAYATRFLILFIDLFLATVSYILATFLRFNFEWRSSISSLSASLVAVLIARLICFRWFKTYAVIVRFAGSTDLKRVFYAIFSGTVFFLLFIVIFRPNRANFPSLWEYHGFIFSFSIIIIDFFLALCFISAFRIMMPYLFRLLFYEKKVRTNVLIFGAGQLGALMSKVIKEDSNSKFDIAAIIDDNPDVHLKSLNGIPVYSPVSIKNIIKKYNVEKAIIAIQKISLKRKNEFVDICLENGIQVMQVPLNTALIDHHGFDENQIKPIKIEDLLNRPSITLGEEIIRKELHDKRVLITGGAGSIGSELVRLISGYSPEQLIIVDQSESPLVNLSLEIEEEYNFDKIEGIIADVSDMTRMEAIFSTYHPHIVFHAAAYKHVPIMEKIPREAISVNVKGTKQIADLSNKYSVDKFIMVSTDKAVNPTNVMGASKRIAEMYIQSLDQISKTQYITTRFGNVLGSNGSVVPRFRKQIEQGGPVTVTHKDITRYFMTIPEASQLVLEAGAMGNGGEIYLFDMGEPVKIYDLAEKIVKLSGYKPNEDIEIKITGLRPGEKLIEELLTHNENSIPTHHPKITKAKNQEFDFSTVSRQVSTLIKAINKEDDMHLVTLMKAIIPEYISNNSKFSVLDK